MIATSSGRILRDSLGRISLAAAIGVFAVCWSAAHAAEPLDNFPFVITCEYKGMHHAYYLSRLDAGGVATYITPDRLAGTISVDGTAKASGESKVGTCLGKTLKELRSSGQARDLKG
ncbi:hypothetical protein ASC97_03570 [Rhizobium sp. Root1203]|uniref:hypothetical protein n=1 Tax=Rhizobium sp. Root1203 TaxID=1736427 RepID=UPI00070C5D57|nr:hypothetical protein [Rhizobium sp. Root1203]KQV32656.1 hypothetical protein ASC97_03570 [Rhizobium sp. Root1203]